MTSTLYESDLEKFTIELLEKQGYSYLAPRQQQGERPDISTPILHSRLRDAIDRLNPDIPGIAKEQALREVLNLPHQGLIENNEAFYQMLTDGVGVEYQKGGETVGEKVWLVDFEEPLSNSLLICNQFRVVENNITKRLDIVIFINGFPFVVIELKNPTDASATVSKAIDQLQTYKGTIPSVFCYNGILVVSDGSDTKFGSLTTDQWRFAAWKTVDGIREDKSTIPQIETLVKGLLRPDTLLDIVKHFTVFEKVKRREPETGLTTIETVKKISAYHQYHAVNKAVESTIEAAAEASQKMVKESAFHPLYKTAQQRSDDRRAGVVWHTQGSGKSLSMVFYAGKLVVNPYLGNPTLVVITDRNDLDDQLFATFASSKQLLRQEPVQADNRSHLKMLLKTAGGGIVFTTIQKFSPDDGGEVFELLSDRKNIIVIVDEAHRSQYGFGAKTLIKDGEILTRYGFAKYLRDALPRATFVGFTGTPIEKEDASTPAIFGNYIDIYDIKQAVEDGATVPIYYESRLAKVHLKDDEKEKLDAEVEKITEAAESTAAEKAKAKWTQLEAIVGHKDRLKAVAQDIVEHFDARLQVLEGKGMIVTMSRRIAVELYGEIVKLRPDWHAEDKKKGAIKVVMTSASSDPARWRFHNTTKQEKKEIGNRFKDSVDPLKLVIVRDMWLTGFDAPCLHTMYIDKLMRGHNLMQAIARVNRVYKKKPGGRIVDYIGIASDLKKALATYTESGGKGSPTLNQEDAIVTMQEKYEIVAQMFHDFDYKRYFDVDTKEKMTIILEAQEYILGLDDGKNRFMEQVGLLSRTFALAVPSREAMEIKGELGFFQAVRARLIKFELAGSGKSDVEVETAIRQIVDRAVVVEGVVDIFDAAGIKKPDISILSDEFLEEIRSMPQRNIARELLYKILNDEIGTRTKRNLILSKKFSEMLEIAIRKYQNNVLTAAQVIEELIDIAKEIKISDARGGDLNLSEDEIAFYDTLAANECAEEVLGDDTLREIARVLVEKVKANATIDWMIKEDVQAKLRLVVKKVLRKYGYPPDKQQLTTENILKQAAFFADKWSN